MNREIKKFINFSTRNDYCWYSCCNARHYMFATYITAYNKLYDAAGMEAYGCANITTGLIRPEDMEKHLLEIMQQKIILGMILTGQQHKDIFQTQYILTLDGTLLALDDHLAAEGLCTR